MLSTHRSFTQFSTVFIAAIAPVSIIYYYSLFSGVHCNIFNIIHTFVSEPIKMPVQKCQQKQLVDFTNVSQKQHT